MRLGWLLTAAATATATTAHTAPATRAAAVRRLVASSCCVCSLLPPPQRQQHNNRKSLFLSSSPHYHNRRCFAMAASSPCSETLQVKRLSQDAVLPVRGSEWAAGYDLASAEDTTIPAGGKGLIKTELSIAIPRDTYARIAPRSGLALKKHIDVGAGVIDYDYRGPVGVVLFNHGQEDFPVKKGDRVAQMILERICMAPVVEVDALPETARGAGGFGSTGVSEAVSAENGNKRLKQGGDAAMDVVDGAKPGEKGAQLLTLLHDVAQQASSPADAALAKSLKPLALAEDARLYAALGAYLRTQDKGDLLDTLRLLAPSEQ